MAALVSHFKHGLASLPYLPPLFDAKRSWILLCYLLSLSVAGFFLLKILPMRDHATARPGDVDLFFMSVTANTQSSLHTVEMEEFSNLQLATLALLMAVSGEIFLSLLGLCFQMTRPSQTKKGNSDRAADHAELGNGGPTTFPSSAGEEDLGLRSAKHLFYVAVVYFLTTHVARFLLILLYLGIVQEANDVLKSKGLNASMFSISMTVSSLANCRFVPTNENMAVFRTSPGLLLIVAAQVLVGNTMYAPGLWVVIWYLEKATRKPEYQYLLRKSGEVGFKHLVPGRQAASLAHTVAALAAVQFFLLCKMEWASVVFSGLSPYQKIAGAAFMSVNSRYGGKSIVDVSAVSPAITVLFIVMMYLPPYTCFLPGEDSSSSSNETHEMKKGKMHLGLVFSPPGYIAIFTIIACITESQRIFEDPLNFSILNIVFEIVSAYGGVGYSTGYSCERRLKAEAQCGESSAGFAARWSTAGKLLLIVVMLFGRMKKHSSRGGKSWLFQ